MKLRLLIICLFVSSFSVGQSGFCGLENKVINPGEQVDFVVYYNLNKLWIPAGKVTFTTQLSNLSGVPVYHIVGKGQTYPSYDWIYKVEDTYESFIDTSTLLSMKFVRKVNENRKKKDEYVRLVPSKNKAFTNFKEFTIPDCTQDVLSSVYYARNLDFNSMKNGSLISYNMFLDEEVHQLYIRYLGKETITTRYGTFTTFKLRPLLVEGTVFKGGEDMDVYVTDDDNRIPVRIKTKILVGSIIVDMVSFKGQRYPMKALLKKLKE
ncbi:MAG TPA: DUF3108 domain-containing protein [Edaphocola sp.]|nr:DUF3108 domain-containing protein [Edaphocola sp.]